MSDEVKLIAPKVSIEELQTMILRAEKATEGEWTYNVDEGVLYGPHTVSGIEWLSCCNWDEHTMNFVAHARTDLPRVAQYAMSLLEEKEQLRDLALDLWGCLNDFASSYMDGGNVVESRGNMGRALADVIPRAKALLGSDA